MNGPFSAESLTCGGRRNRRAIACFVAALLFLSTLFPVVTASFADDAMKVRPYERRAVAERTSRSRFRRLEVASLVLIVICGGAVTLWAIRRK